LKIKQKEYVEKSLSMDDEDTLSFSHNKKKKTTTKVDEQQRAQRK